MPYKTKQQMRMRKQKRYARYYRNYRNAGKKALSMVRFLKKEMLNVEKKIHDINFTQTASMNAYDNATDAQHFINLNTLSTGTGSGDRVGRQVKIDSIHIKGILKGQNNANSRVRVMLLLDKHCQGSSYPTSASLLDTGASSSSVNSFRTLGYAQRFFIMFDKTFDIIDGDSKESRIVNLYRNVNKIIKWDDSNYINGNNYYLYIISDQTVASGNSADFRGKIRVKFIDN